MPDDVIVPTKPKGYTTQPTTEPWASWDLSTEHVPELMWPWTVEVYDRMRTNPAVATVIMAVSHPLRSAKWWIDPAGARDEVVRLVAGDLNLPVTGQPEVTPLRTRGRFSWRDHFRLALTSQWNGAAYFEQEAEIVNGMAHLRRLGFRPLKTLAEPPKVDRDGSLVSIKQNGLMNEKAHEIPVSQLVAYVREREGGNWLGTSILRAAYEPWLLRDRNVRLDTIKNDRYGVGTPWHEAATDDQAEVDAGLEIAKQFRSGAESGLSTRNGGKWSIVTPMGSVPDILSTIEYHDRKIAGVALGHWMNLGQQKSVSGSSYALGSVQVGQFTNGLQTVLNDHRDIAQAHIVEDLVDWNWGPDEPAPRLCVEEINDQWTAQALAQLAQAGFLFPDRQTEEWLRQELGAPPKTNTAGGSQ